jgi:uncharacterized protein YoxC
MANLDELEKTVNMLQEQVDGLPFEPMNLIEDVGFDDLSGSSSTDDIATAVNTLRETQNTILGELRRISLMQIK